MKEIHYLAMTQFLRRTPRREAAAKLFCRGIPVGLFVWYAAVSASLLFTRDGRLVKFLLVPFSGFLAVSFLRSWLNCPRPYERYRYEPLFPAHHKGKSFPSRHTACAFLLAMAILWIEPRAGWLGIGIAALVGGSRVAAGMHEPKDVLAGLAFGVLWSTVGFWMV